MTIRGLGKKKLKTLEKELEKLKQDLKEWDAVNKKGVVGTTNHVLPLQIAEHIRQYEGQIEKLKAKKGGRRTRSTRSTRALTARRR
jgi:prefoldin subunit 5